MSSCLWDALALRGKLNHPCTTAMKTLGTDYIYGCAESLKRTRHDYESWNSGRLMWGGPNVSLKKSACKRCIFISVLAALQEFRFWGRSNSVENMLKSKLLQYRLVWCNIKQCTVVTVSDLKVALEFPSDVCAIQTGQLTLTENGFKCMLMHTISTTLNATYALWLAIWHVSEYSNTKSESHS